MVETDTSPELTTLRVRQESDAGMFGLLARLWISEIDLPLLRTLATGKLRELYLEVGGMLPAETDQDTVDQLACEYCACFLGPRDHLPPYQSVVIRSQFQSECVESMESYLEVMGQLEGVFAQQKMLDHAGVQLKMGQVICNALGDGLDNSGHDVSKQLAGLKSEFYRDHLNWIRPYCDVAGRQSSSQFYSALFRITTAFLEEQLNESLALFQESHDG